MADLGLLLEGPHPEERIVERVETSESYGSRPLDARAAQFRAPSGGTLVVMTIAAPDAGKNTVPAFISRLSPRDATKAKRFLGEESFRLEGTGAERVAQARVLLEAGVWDVTILAVETGVALSGLHRGTIEVRAPVEPLSVSDLVLARTLEPVPYRSMISYDEPYVIGAFRVVPRVQQSLPAGAPAHLFYELYGGSAPYAIDYQLEGREFDGTWRELGPPATIEDSGRAQGYTLHTKESWPAGDYRFRVLVRDSAGVTTGGVVDFKLEAVSPGAATPLRDSGAPAVPPPAPRPATAPALE